MGSVGLLLALLFILMSGFSTSMHVYSQQPLPDFIILLLVIGFGVKLPIWPCFSWLLKAHVEASVEFSILLSGIVVKFGALGLQRVLQLQEGSLGGLILACCSLIAVLEASLRMLAQRDLKRIVALTTVVEINWVGFCVSVGGYLFEQIAALILVAHSLTTTAEFFIVECIYRRYHTRDVISISGLNSSFPFLHTLSFLNILTTIGFPGTSLFAAKLLFFSALFHYSLLLFCVFLVCLVLWLPLVFIRI